MKSALKVRFRIHVSAALLYWGLVGLCLLAAPAQIVSESMTVNMSTYYPAPSGAYQDLMTAGQTWLARDTGSVGIGTAAPGAAAKLAVMDPSGGAGGRVGVGTSSPGDRVEIDETGASGGLLIDAAIPGLQFGNSNTALGLATGGGQWSASAAAGDVILRSNAGQRLILEEGGVGPSWSSAIAIQGGNVGIANPNPGAALDVGGDIISRACAGVMPTPYEVYDPTTQGVAAPSGITLCPSGYATWIPGVMSNYQTEPLNWNSPYGAHDAVASEGEMLCCPCTNFAGGVCPSLP